MDRKSIKIHGTSLLLALAMVMALLFGVHTTAYAAEGTEGTEIQVLEAEKLEIQLGADWAGVEFELKTDAGMYPGTIAVGEDGVLRLEIGGSSSYILTCLNSGITAPEPTQASATEEGQPEDVQTETEPAGQESLAEAGQAESNPDENQTESETHTDPEGQSNTVAGIPVVHLVVFGVGMALAVGSLIIMHVLKRRRDDQADDDDDILDADDDDME